MIRKKNKKLCGPYGPVIIACHWPELARRLQIAGGPVLIVEACIFWYPLPSSMFSLLHLLQSFSPCGLTISVPILLFSHLCLPNLPKVALISLFLIFSILFIPIINPNILISDLSGKFFSAFLRVQVSLPYIRTGLMTV